MQPSLSDTGVDANQYHLFCDDGRIFGIWLLRSEALAWQWAWVYDKETTRTFYRSESRGEQDAGAALHVSAPGFEIATNSDGSGTIKVADAAEATALEASFGVPSADVFGAHLDPALGGRESAFEYPNFEVDVVEFGGRSTRAIGYMKRFTWPVPPDASAWLFLQGNSSDRAIAISSADATFGFSRCLTFRVESEKSGFVEADPETTHHGYDSVHALGSDGQITVRYAAIGPPVVCLVQNGGGLSVIRHTPVSFLYSDGSGDRSGTAVYENGYLTLAPKS